MKKLLILSMVLVLCLATVGVGYAKWKGDLHVEGQVGTAVLAMEWCDVKVKLFDPCDEAEVAQAEIVGDTVKIKVKKAYPGVSFLISLKARNVGNLPANVLKPIVGELPDGLKVKMLTFLPWFCEDAEEPADPCIEDNPLKIYPEKSKVGFNPFKWKFNAVWTSYLVTVTQDAGMGECLEFTIKLPYEQVCPSKPC